MKNLIEPPCDLRAIEIHGASLFIEEDVYISAQKILKEALDIKIVDRDLDDCFFIGGKPNATDTGNEITTQSTDSGGSGSGQGQPRGILIVRFATRRLRDVVFKTWREKRATENVFKINGVLVERFKIAERLNRATRMLLKDTRNAARESGWRHVWTKGGRILVRRENTGRVSTIQSSEDLKIFKK